MLGSSEYKDVRGAAVVSGDVGSAGSDGLS